MGGLGGNFATALTGSHYGHKEDIAGCRKKTASINERVEGFVEALECLRNVHPMGLAWSRQAEVWLFQGS
jgi:hypothetical protein